MKLLTKPELKREVIVWEEPARRETRFNPFGVFGIGPISTTVEIPGRTRTSSFPGRSVIGKVEIDFEGDDAITACVDVGEYEFIKKKTAFALMFDGLVYILRGVVPEELLRDNIWLCNIDHIEF